MRPLRLRASATKGRATGQWLGFLLPLAVVALVSPSSIARATTRTVSSLADSGAGTLRDAIAASDDGDTIDFSVTGTINLTSGSLVVVKGISITGPGANLLEVTRTAGVFRIFTISAATQNSMSISGIAITNGHAASGQLNGGGIENNAASATVMVSNCIISGNTAEDVGGGIANSPGGSLLVSDCTFSNNAAAVGGGGIDNGVGTITVRNSTFSGNSAGSLSSPFDFGGGISNENGTATVSNCTLSGNSASDAGGGIANVGSGGSTANLMVSNSTVSGNSASSGGGIYNAGTSGGNAFVNLGNTILTSTSDMPGANLVNVGLGTSITSEGYNLSSDDGGGFLTAAGDQINTDPKLGPLQGNGGPTATMALLPGSPAQDQGKSFGVITDQRGFLRPVDNAVIPNAGGGDGSDIGAVEMDAAQSGITFAVTTTADHDDGSCTFDDCTLREAINLTDATAGANTITFNSGVTGVITLQPALGTLTVTDSVTIAGPGAELLAVSGNHAIRVFSFSSGRSAMTGLTIRDGTATVGAGSGIATTGGGVFNQSPSSLFLTDCSFSGNHVQGADNATAGGAGGDGNGGAIGTTGALTLTRCTFSGNSAVGGRGGDGIIAIGGNLHGGAGGAGLGGAIFSDTGATLTITESTFGGNSAAGGAGGDGEIGGNGGNATVGAFNAGTMIVSAATFAGNVGAGGAGGKGGNKFNGGSPGAGRGGLTAGGGTSLIRNTISAGNTGNGGGGSDADGTFTSGGYNLIGIGDSSTGFTGTGDQVGTTAAPLNANLGPLQGNGGPTATFALLCGSPAIDQGTSNGLTGILTTDQRGAGFTRTLDDAAIPNAPGGDGTDIGAFELQGTCTSPGLTPTPTPTPTLSPQGAATATPTLTPTTKSTCAGDCDGNTAVTADELLTMIDIALGDADVALCQAGNVNHDDEITIDEILTAVHNALDGCPGA